MIFNKSYSSFIVKIPRAMRVVIEVLLIEKQTSFDIMKLAWQLTTKNEGGLSMKDTKSLSHTSYRCKYHIVIVPKYRRMVIYNKLRKDIGQIIRMLCERKPGVMLLEAEACPDHIHMLLEIPPKYSIAEFMGYLKSKSTLMIFERHANMKYKFGNRKFWARGYFVDTVGKNEKAIREYIQNQLQEDKLADQMSLKEFIDPFTGEPVK